MASTTSQHSQEGHCTIMEVYNVDVPSLLEMQRVYNKVQTSHLISTQQSLLCSY